MHSAHVYDTGNGGGVQTRLRIEKMTPEERRGQHEPDARMSSSLQKHQFTLVVLVLHAIFVVLFALFASYDPSAMPGSVDDQLPLASKYSMFQDTHVMIFIGFGFLMTFLKRYGFSAVSVNLLLACFTIEWGLLVRGFLSEHFAEHGTFTIGIDELLTADFAAAVVLISMGAMLGKLSPVQYLIMAFIETPVALAVEHQLVHRLHINDAGGSIIVHAFGAYFGLACSRAFAKKEQREHEHEGSVYHSDIFAMIGAIFLWVFWPSFNAAVAATADGKQRAVINTFLSLAACTLTTFLTSQLVDHKKRFNMVHVANSTLAGGVAIGTTANVILDAWAAMAVGSVAGVISVLGYQYLTPFLSRRLAIHDTCGVHNLHGMPGVIAAIVSAIAAVCYNKDRYGSSLASIYPAMAAPSNNDEAWQAGAQLLALAAVLVASVLSGGITGFILRLPVWNQVRTREYFSDGDYFETPGDYDFTTRIMSSIDHVEINEKTALQSKAEA